MTDDDQQQPAELPEFGPGGYLPDRASRRARKIVLRAPMGLHWIVGSLAVAIAILALGSYALGRDTTPQPPFVRAVDEVALAPDIALMDIPSGGDTAVLVVTAGGRPRAFVPPDGVVRWCDESGLIQSDDGRAWRPTGRGLGGVASLIELPIALHEGALWVDPSAPLAATPTSPDAPALGCA